MQNASILHKRTMRIFILVCNHNPPFTMLYVQGHGVVNSEWDFCYQQLQYLLRCAKTEPNNHNLFNTSARPILSYLNQKRKKK